MLTNQDLVDAEALVKSWHDHWMMEGRIDGGLDKFARQDLVERLATALANRPAPNKQTRKKAQANG